MQCRGRWHFLFLIKFLWTHQPRKIFSWRAEKQFHGTLRKYYLFSRWLKRHFNLNNWFSEINVEQLTRHRGSTHGPCSCSQQAGQHGAVLGGAAVHRADEAAAGAVHVPVHITAHGWAPGVPQGAVPVETRGWGALQVGPPMSTLLHHVDFILLPGGAGQPTDTLWGGGEEVGQGGVLLWKNAADSQR